MFTVLAFSVATLAAEPGVSVVVAVNPDGAQLLDAVLGAAVQGTPRPGDGPALEVLDLTGQVLATVPIPSDAHRSIIGPDGRGESAELIAYSVRVVAPWPAGAYELRVGEQRLRPHARPPGVPVAVQESGPDTERLDLVILGDGYLESELDTFASDAQRLIDHLGRVDPYGAYSGLFNVWRIDQASNESGATHLESNPTVERDTAYGCYYGCGGIARLVCCDDADVLSEISATVPAADGAIVLVNDPTYGGAGGWQYATSYNGQDWGMQVAAHELGHSLVGLWDEYSYGYANNGDEGPNCTSNTASPSWEVWLDQPGVGTYAECSYTNLYRPTDNACMMNGLQDTYCPVCREQAVLAILSHLPGLITSTVPDKGEEVVGAETGELSFSATALGPDDGSLSLIWDLDGAQVGEGPGLTLPACGASGTLTLTAHDPTPWVRQDPEGRLTDSVSWTLTRPDCPAGDDSGEDSGGGSDDGDKDTPGRCGCASGGGAGGLLGALAFALRRRVRRSHA